MKGLSFYRMSNAGTIAQAFLTSYVWAIYTARSTSTSAELSEVVNDDSVWRLRGKAS